MKKKIKKFCFDLDGVICKTVGNDYKNSKPIKRAIAKVNFLYSKGHYIIIYTSRFMGRSKENAKKAHKRGYKSTLTQLNSWDLKFHKLIMGKPSFDIYVDDKAIGFKENWHKNFYKFLKNKYD